MWHKDVYYVKVWDDTAPELFGIGEAAPLTGLSRDDRPDFESRLTELCALPITEPLLESLIEYPSIRFALETAIADLCNSCCRTPYPSLWTKGESTITINGLVWMGDEALMMQRMEQKVSDGFRCIKIKIGGIDFKRELHILKSLRNIAPQAELRLDANGAFSPSDALHRLDELAKFDIHSIEQPIRAGQRDSLRQICSHSPIPIALDEELIQFRSADSEFLADIKPAYIILKPTLLGGIEASQQWIDAADELGIGWWITSALESNIGLNAIAQWCAALSPSLPQGLGTGQLFTNNIPSPLSLSGEYLSYNASEPWHLPTFDWH